MMTIGHQHHHLIILAVLAAGAADCWTACESFSIPARQQQQQLYRRATTIVLFEAPPSSSSDSADEDNNKTPAPPSSSSKSVIAATAAIGMDRGSNNAAAGTTSASNNGSGDPRRRRRGPAFPRQAYPLLQEEQDLKHIFISFIDQSIVSSYSQTVRLVEPRKYAKPDQFLESNANVSPTIEDVAEPASLYGPIATFFAWNGLPARAVVGTMSYLAFPFLIDILEEATRSFARDDLASLVNIFLPGVSIVLGTYFSLTISILYDRYAKLQQAVNSEASLLAMTCHNLLLFFRDRPDMAVDSTQCIADQVRTLVFDSRGKETMGIVYHDPYARILHLLKESRGGGGSHDDDQLLSNLYTSVNELFSLRSKRMNYESLALGPTHYDVMTFLSALLLVGYCLGTVATAQTKGVPVELSSLLFASLVVCYTIFYEMAFDLNRPYDGIYQLRRQGAAMHFLQIKELVCNHPLVAGHVDFEEIIDQHNENIDLDCDGDCKERQKKIWYN